MSKTESDYGIDSPGVIKALISAGLLLILAGNFFNNITVLFFTFGKSFVLLLGYFLVADGALRYFYSKIGKYRHRVRMLKMIEWNGYENVLDVGTGRGLILIGAAKKLSGGRSVGIDIWNKETLSNNAPENTMLNAEAEGVLDKIELFSQDVRKINFPDNYFDVIFSNRCLHNIHEISGKKKACDEIYRVLKPGGTAVISDYKKIKVYKKIFKAKGAKIKKYGPYIFTTLPASKILKITKPI